VQRFGVTKEQEEQFKMCLVKAMITSCIAFNFADNGYLAKALAILGMKPLTRKQVAGTYLDQLAAGEQEWSRTAIEGMEYPPGASDGWRKKYCISGAGLMNFTVMGDKGTMYSMVYSASVSRTEPSATNVCHSAEQSLLHVVASYWSVSMPHSCTHNNALNKCRCSAVRCAQLLRRAQGRRRHCQDLERSRH
jgi:hypothetical protein